VSRGHTLEALPPEGGRPFPVISLVGGKWTTFRALAEQTADRVLAGLGLARKGSTQHVPIGGGCGFPVEAAEKARWIARVAKETGLAESRVASLAQRYGDSAEAYARGASPEDERALASLPSYTLGEVRRIVAEEQVEHLADLVIRRSLIALLGEAREDVLRELTDIAGAILGWDAARKANEVSATLREVAVPATKAG
jgi:glycerol-3-phosphate dehydrogenase